MSKELIEKLNEQVLTYDEWAREKCIEKLAADRIEQLEAELKTERVLSFRTQLEQLEAERDELQQHLDTTIDVLNQTRVERDELKAALKRIAVTKPAMVMNGNAKMDDPPDVKVNYNTVFIARAAIAKGEKNG